jgi:hypothetical protein
MQPKLVVALLIAALSSGATRAPASPPEPEAGLLLGLSNGRTLWIAQEGDSMRVVWETPHLVVPRSDGYWFVVSVERCGVDIDNAHGGGGVPYAYALLDRRQAIGIARAGRTVDIALDERRDCDEATKDVVAARERRYRVALDSAKGDWSKVEIPSANEPVESYDCSISSDRVTFLSATAIGVEHRYSQTEYCSPGGYATGGSNSVLQFGTTRQIALRPLLTPSARRDAAKLGGGDQGCAFDKDPERLDDSWIPKRAEGRWVAVLWLDGPNVCRGGSEYDLNIPLPRSFTGEQASPVRWRALVRENKGLTDAIGSPSGAFVALRVNDSLTIRRVRDSHLAEVVGRVAGLSMYDVAMIRWATPAEAEQWTRQLPTLTPPAVRVTAPPR